MALSIEGPRRPAHMKRRLRSAVLALAMVGGTFLGGMGGAHPTAAQASSCALQTLAQAPVSNGTNQKGTVLLLKNGCDGKIFGRISTPYWAASVSVSLKEGMSCNLDLCLNPAPLSNSAFLAFGGHVDTPEVAPIPGHQYYVYASEQLGLSPTSYGGRTPTWTA